MIEDAAARALLDEVVVEWTDGGVLGELRQLIGAVWRRNLDRWEPRLGDDAVSLGVQSSRNVCNLAVHRLQNVREVQARDVRTLEVSYRRRDLHVQKVTSRSPAWDVFSADWSDSDVRSLCAEANSRAYQRVSGTLFDSAGPMAGAPGDPRALRYLQLVWQGFDDGGTCCWVGFPAADEQMPWFAVVQLGDDPGGSGGLDADGGGPVLPVSPVDLDFDTLPEPEVDLRRVEREARQPPQRG